MANIVRTGGGEPLKLNVYCQPNEPNATDGIWLKTAQKIKPHIAFDATVDVNQWIDLSVIQDFPETLLYACCAAIEDEIYIFNGNYADILFSTMAYSPKYNSYRSLAKIPHKNQNSCCAAIGEKIYVFCGEGSGGMAGSDKATSISFVYDAVANTYKDLENSPYAATEPFCASIGSEIYIFGGRHAVARPGGTDSVDTAVVYNTQTDTYKTVSSLPEPRHGASCVSVGNEIYIFGGKKTYAGSTQSLTTAIAYDTASDTYRSLPDMPIIVNGKDCIKIDDLLYLPGPENTLIYDIQQETYTAIVHNWDCTSSGCCAVIGRNIYLFGTGEFRQNASMMRADIWYPNDPTAVIVANPKNYRYSVSTLETRLVGRIPIYCSDVVLYQNGNVLQPALYRWDGAQWTQVRGEIVQ